MDLFSLEVVDNEILCVCNRCDTGLDNESELIKQERLTSGQTARAEIVAYAWNAQ